MLLGQSFAQQIEIARESPGQFATSPTLSGIDEEVKEAQEILGMARGIVGQVETVTTAITKPVTGLRNLLMGVGYGMKYLLKRNRPDYEEEEV